MQKKIEVDGEEHEVPARWIICDRCEGTGSHTNPAVDGNGITQSEFAEWDPEERAAYFSGRYDVKCEECGGDGKMLVVHEEALKREDPELYEAFQKEEEEEADYRQMARDEQMWERRMMYGSDY